MICAQTIVNAHAILLQQRDALRRGLDGELSLVGRDDDDKSQEDEAYFWLAETESRELIAVEDALERIREGRYGRCTDCGDNIPQARLRALPCATLCIKFQQQSECHESHSQRSPHTSRTAVFA